MPGVLAMFTAAELGLEPMRLSFIPRHGRLLVSDVVRYVGEPVAVVLTELPKQGEDAAERSSSTTSRCPWSSTSRTPRRRAPLLFPDAGTNICSTRPRWACPSDHRRRVLRGLRGRRAAARRQPAGRAVPARGPLRGGGVVARRPRAPVAQHPARPGRPRHDRRPRARRGRGGPGHRPRRRRRLRRQDRRATRRRCSSPGSPRRRAACAVAGDPLGEHGRPSATAGRRCRTSRSAAPATARCSPTASRCCRTAAPLPRSAPILAPFMTRPMSSGVYDYPEDRVQGGVDHHQHDAHRRLSRCGSPRGHRRRRAGHGPVRRGDRHGPGRGAAPQPHPQFASLTPPHRADLRQRRLRRGLEKALAAAGYDELRAEQSAARGPTATRCSSASA